MDTKDFETIRTEIFDYQDKLLLPELTYTHLKIPIFFSDFWEDRNLIISNISNIFGDFMETYITRCILQNKKIKLDHHDYIMMCLSETKYYIDKLHDPLIKEYIDNK